MNFVGKVCCNSCDTLLAQLKVMCETRPAPADLWVVIESDSVYNAVE